MKRNTSIAIGVVTTNLNITEWRIILFRLWKINFKIGTLFLLIKNKLIFLWVLSRWRRNEQPLSKNCMLQNSMANFETVKMLAKEVDRTLLY